MLSEDTEVSRLSQLPGVADLLQLFKENFTKVCEKLFEFGLEERFKQKSEAALFFSCLHDAIEQNRNESVNHIEKFKQQKDQVFSFLW